MVVKKYFYNILHDPFHNKFRLPNWVPTLQQPTIPCNHDPPTYPEIATVIRKCKLRAYPCPLDQISIIVFKKCPMLRTILHQLIVECWRGQISDHYDLHFENAEIMHAGFFKCRVEDTDGVEKWTTMHKLIVVC
ncbi:hypothetical protein HELRODRAFT_177863 [Helobdella robusta]|uniref:Uncharacterized protein n=1 Tax=Helobdella robusta TaxID=6412 RepID=T1FCD7_HELRO|nr:hypothetical protein HELRODRAFT_177863 [Helobdella robusta]ESN97798.1 hypothetical protein HELRODRAFT_177863 [Helobdella robusta]